MVVMRGDSLRPMDPIVRESLNFTDEILVFVLESRSLAAFLS